MADKEQKPVSPSSQQSKIEDDKNSDEKRSVRRFNKKKHRQEANEDEELPTVKAWWVPEELKDEIAPTVEEVHIMISLNTKQEQYAVPQYPISVREGVEPQSLSKLIRLCLKQAGQVVDGATDFEFVVDGKLLVGSLGAHLRELDMNFEGTTIVEYFERYPPPTPKENLEHDDWVSSVMSCGDWLVTGCYDNTVQLWTMDKMQMGLGKQAHKLTIPAHKAPVKAVSWLSTNKQVKSFVSCSIDQTAIVWEWDSVNNSVECIWDCRGHTQSVECVAVALKGLRFITGSWDNMIKIWNGDPESSSGVDDTIEEEEPDKKRVKRRKEQRMKTPIMTLSGHSESVSGVGWVSSNEILSCSWDHSVRLWDLNAGRMVSQTSGNVAFFCLSYSQLNNCLLTGSADRQIRLYDPRSKEGTIVKCKFTNHSKWVPTVRWSPTDENQFVSGSYDNSVRVWDRRSPAAPVYNLLGHNDKVLSVDWSFPSHIASGSADCMAQIYDVK